MTTSTTSKTTAAGDAAPVLTLAADLSPAVAAIEKAYRQLQRAFPDAPDVTIVVKRDERAWGHTTVAKVWAPATATTSDRFELMISGENLRRGAEAVAGTLLHEAVHARHLAAGVLDTDVNGRHNLLFKAGAEEHGLSCEQAGWHGWTKTELSAEGRQRWAKMIRTIEAGLAKAAAAAAPNLDHLGRPAKPAEGEGEGETETPAPTPPRKRGDRNLVKATCACGFSIRASRGVLDKARPRCEECQEPFEAVS
jgi:hypothetical protein